MCFDPKAVGIGLAIYTLLIALFSGFLGPVIAGALVQEMGSFSQAMVVNGAVMVGAGLLMVVLAVWERRQARAAAADEDHETEDHAVVAVDEADRNRDVRRRRQKDVELA